MPASSQASNNFDEYESRYRADLEAEHLGRYALMHNGKVVGIFDDKTEAFDAGSAKYGIGRFSFHEIGGRPVHIGSLASAMT